MAFLPSRLWGMGRYQPSRYFLDGSPSQIKMWRTPCSIASSSFAMRWWDGKVGGKTPLPHPKGTSGPSCLPGTSSRPSTATPYPLVCAMGLQLRLAVLRKITPHYESWGVVGEQGACASSILVSLFKHWLSIAPGELGGSMCLSGTQQP